MINPDKLSLSSPRSGRLRYWLPLLLIAFAFLSRLPQFLSPFFYPDTDEAVVGLMARHITEGKDFPVYFYGQSYGLAGLEAAMAALFFLLFGISAYSLKASMLFLWTAGVWFHAEAFRRWKGERAALVIALLLLISPGWAIWSMKARGGYVTAFFLEGMILWLLAGNSKTFLRWIAIGFCLYLMYEAQMLWLTVVLPFVAWRIIAGPRLTGSAALLLGGVLAYLLIGLLVPDDQSDYWRPAVTGEFELWNNLKRLPKRIATTLSGSFDLIQKQPIGWANDMSSWLWAGILAVLAVISFVKLRKRKEELPFRILFLSCLILIVGYTFIANPQTFSHRYLLPLAGLVPVWLGYELHEVMSKGKTKKWLSLAILAVISIFSVLSLSETKNHRILDFDSSHHHIQETDKLIGKLEKQGIHHVFCVNGMFQWQLNFLSQERVTCRYYGLTDRYMPYIREVNNAYRQGKPTAIVGYIHEVNPLTAEKGIDSSLLRTDDMFFYLPNPDTAVLKKAGFEMP